MLALAITLAVVLLIALLRFGVIVEYNDEGFLIWVKAGFLKFRLLEEEKKKRLKRLKQKKKKVVKYKKDLIKDFTPGSLQEFISGLKNIGNMLKRIRKRLLIKELTLYYTSAGEDPANVALQFGAANAAIETIVPMIKRNFRIRRLDLKTAVDFESLKPGIYAKASISIAVWEVFYIISALLPMITSALFKKRPEKTSKINKNDIKEGKDGKNNGQSPNQRLDGNDNEKNEGHD